MAFELCMTFSVSLLAMVLSEEEDVIVAFLEAGLVAGHETSNVTFLTFFDCIVWMILSHP